MNLPNKLTIARVIAVPFFIAAYLTGWYLPAFVIFVLASLTDMLDGKIARKHNLVTNFGKIMDPLADKILVYSDDSGSGAGLDADHYFGERVYGRRHAYRCRLRGYCHRRGHERQD